MKKKSTKKEIQIRIVMEICSDGPEVYDTK